MLNSSSSDIVYLTEKSDIGLIFSSHKLYIELLTIQYLFITEDDMTRNHIIGFEYLHLTYNNKQILDGNESNIQFTGLYWTR